MQVQCPGCSKVLNAPDSMAGRVVKCPGCGNQMQLPAVEPPPAISVLPSESDRKACPFCHQPIMDTAVKCRHCGQWLAEGGRSAAREGEAVVTDYWRGMRTLGRALVALDLLLALALVGAVAEGVGGRTGQVTAAILVLVTAGAIGLTVSAFRRQVWANYAAGLSAALMLVFVLVRSVQVPEHRMMGFLLTLLMLILIAASVRNLRLASKARAIGLDPQGAP